jgi:glutaredoxin
LPDPLRFTLYSRPGCGLCEEMIEELAALPQAQGVPLDIADVDQNPLIQARYGHKIPVLLLNGELVCHGRLDSEELHKALAALR